MRHNLLLLGVLAAVLSGSAARAQTTDAPPPKAKAKPVQAAKPAAGKATAAKPASPPPVPMAPPPAPVLPPPITVPARSMPAPVPAAVVEGAAGEATTDKDRLRITFGTGSSDLNPNTDAAIRTLVRAAPPFAGTTFSIVAVAPGTEEDPSTPRRLSLARALAVRSVLITEGIASPRIYVKALGANPQALSGGPPDRADITVAGAPPAAPQGQGKAP